MARLTVYCSSSKNRIIPILSAFRWVGAGCVENGLWRSKRMRHNMGLCRMGWVGGGDGGGLLLFFGVGGSVSG